MLPLPNALRAGSRAGLSEVLMRRLVREHLAEVILEAAVILRQQCSATSNGFAGHGKGCARGRGRDHRGCNQCAAVAASTNKTSSRPSSR